MDPQKNYCKCFKIFTLGISEKITNGANSNFEECLCYWTTSNFRGPEVYIFLAERPLVSDKKNGDLGTSFSGPIIFIGLDISFC